MWLGHCLCRKPLNRRFIVVEGIYLHSGELAPLADIFRLKEQYKWVHMFLPPLPSPATSCQ